MKFLCLCHYDQAKFAACTPEDFQAVGAICAPRDQALYASGRVDLVGSMAAPDAYAVIRPGDDGPSVSRGPYATTPEPWGAFFIVDADNIEQAIEIAQLHPGAHLGRYFAGGIEVRPCEHYIVP
ncbi:MAG: YciI family protein [Lysobacter sp.]